MASSSRYRGPDGSAARAAILWLFVLAVLFAWLGARGLNEPDEGRYAEIGREMAVSGDWLMPHLNGFEHVQKPPLLYWATALSFRFFGYDERAARLACALPALGTLFSTWFLAGALFSQRTRPLAVLILLSSCEFVLLSRALTPDMMLTFWITLAMVCVVKYIRFGRQWWWRLGFFVAIGLGFLSKGPMALVVPVSATLCWQIGLRRSGERVPLRWGSGLAISVIVGGWWFVVVALQHPALIGYFLGYELRDRLFSTVHGRAQPFWFFVPVVLGGTLPWTPVLLAASLSAVRRLRAPGALPANLWLLGGWVLPPLVVLSLTGSKLPTYVLPLFPALALLMAHWCDVHDAPRAGRFIAASVAMALLLAAALPVALVVLRWFVPPYAQVSFSLGFAAVLVVLIAVFSGLLLIDRRRTMFIALALGCGAATLWAGVITQADRLLLVDGGSVRPLADIIKTLPDADSARIFAVSVRGHGLEFYLRKLVSRTENQTDIVLPPNAEQTERVIWSVKNFERGLSGHPAIGIVNPREIRSGGPFASWHVLGKSGRYILITNDALLHR